MGKLLSLGDGVKILTPTEQKKIVGGMNSIDVYCKGYKNLYCNNDADCPSKCFCSSFYHKCIDDK